jgi:hypothetical protein
MKMKKLNLIILFSYLILTGCSAMFVPETNDPYEKLKWAQLLIERQSRPIPAERLINQAIAICKQNNDYSCLGRAYILYWEFFRSSLIDISGSLQFSSKCASAICGYLYLPKRWRSDGLLNDSPETFTN